MSRFQVTALLALSPLALPASTAFGQVFQGVPNQADRSIQGGVTEKDVPMCQGTAGGSRMRENCDETTPTTVRTEQEPKTILIAVPALPNAQCSATTTTEYYQQSAIARVNSTLAVADCTTASGTFTVALRVRGESGEDRPLEFSETWQRSDDQDVKFTADYPIGENTELRSVRIRALSCTCADPAKED